MNWDADMVGGQKARREASAMGQECEDALFCCSSLGDRAEELSLSSEEVKCVRQFEQKYNSQNMEEPSEEAFYSYFDTLHTLMAGAECAQKAGSAMNMGYMKILEEMLFLGAERSVGKNIYYLTHRHPIILMNQYDRRLMHEWVEECRLTSTELSIVKSFLAVKYRNRSRFKIFSFNQVYEVGESPDTGRFEARPYSKWETNTKIQAIRLWEKVSDYRREHDYDGMVRVACIGQLQQTEELYELCRYHNIEVLVDSFKRNAELGKYYFVEEGEDAVSGCDLMDLSDMDRLFERYQIVLFLDMNCFYRQHQREKTSWEKKGVQNCKWYLNLSRDMSEFRDKVACYQMAYRSVGMWLNSHDDAASAGYEFDEKLFRSLETAWSLSQDTSVFLYVKESSRIGGRNLYSSNVCNDEYYDGNELLVYKFIRSRDINEECKRFIDRGLQTLSVELEFWKLLKSINNSFCDSTLEELVRETGRPKPQIIMLCKQSYCVLSYSPLQIVDEQINVKLRYHVKAEEETGAFFEEKIEEICRVILSYAFQKQQITCLTNYFYDLIVNSVISRANNTEDLLLAYLLKSRKIKTIDLVAEPLERYGRETGGEAAGQWFRVRRTLYAVIEKLADLRLRDTDDRTEYFVYTFRKMNCPELSEQMFRESLAGIAQSCEQLDYVNSILYVNSVLK